MQNKYVGVLAVLVTSIQQKLKIGTNINRNINKNQVSY